jgi:hypothetical protein
MNPDGILWSPNGFTMTNGGMPKVTMAFIYLAVLRIG